MTDNRQRRPNHTQSRNVVHISAAYQVVPPADLVPVDLGPGYWLGLEHALVIADERVKILKYAAQVIQFFPIELGNSDKSPL